MRACVCQASIMMQDHLTVSKFLGHHYVKMTELYQIIDEFVPLIGSLIYKVSMIQTFYIQRRRGDRHFCHSFRENLAK